MIRLESDYLEGAHSAVLKKLLDTNAEQTPGYGEDTYCAAAAALIRERCDMPDAAVHFLVGGTQANRTVIAAVLRPHQGAIAAASAHIAVHETGAIENAGHKVLALPAHGGKLCADEVEAYCAAHYADPSFEHTVQPGMVFISNPTEIGTVYTRSELAALHEVCRNRHIPLYIDGARLGCALASSACDYTLAEMARLCDIFTIGGTKMGALFGEAVVFSDVSYARDFRYFIKQNGGMFAKGRLLGLQFLALLEDGLYDRIAAEEVRLAMKLRGAIQDKGWDFLVDSPSNQQFPVLPDAVLKALDRDFSYCYWQSMGEGMSAVRFCTSWATEEADIDKLIAMIPRR